MTYTEPLLLVFSMIAIIGLARIWLSKRFAVSMLGVVCLLLICWPPIDWLLSRPLEARYPVRPFQPAPVQAIVVLSSAVDPPHWERPYNLPGKETYERCVYAAWLYQHWQHLPVLACGGSSAKGEQPFSVTMREVLHREGVPEAMLWTEERSTSTHENAVYGAELLRIHGIDRIALVVEAQSMLRAEACFRKEGITVAPAPCEFRQMGPLFEELIPSWKAIRRNEATLHEAVGLAWYWLHGWI
jgi:uncharacterized SAM-binding protein YcdF (DUF218 family)